MRYLTSKTEELHLPPAETQQRMNRQQSKQKKQWRQAAISFLPPKEPTNVQSHSEQSIQVNLLRRPFQ